MRTLSRKVPGFLLKNPQDLKELRNRKERQDFLKWGRGFKGGGGVWMHILVCFDIIYSIIDTFLCV
jgi:hypothetical protein